LPVVEELHELPVHQRCCPECGTPFSPSDTEDSEQIEIEVRPYRRRIRRRRYRRTCTCAVGARTLTAAPPPKLIPKGLLGVSVWVEILLDKYSSHRPTERLLASWRQLDLDLAAGTITTNLERLEPLFQPLYEALKERNRLSAYQQADETRWLVFVETAGKKGHRWWLWVFNGQDTVVYVLDPSRSHAVPEGHFSAGVSMVLMVDRLASYKAMAPVKDGLIVLAFCWAHVRRDFIAVAKSYPELQSWAIDWLKLIRAAYRANRERLKRMNDAPKFAVADLQLRDVVETMKHKAAEQLADADLRQPCRKVLVSLQEHWTGLTLFVDDPRIPMDNNRSERRLRGPAVGRKNYYGSGAVWSGQLAMMLFSLFATLSQWTINPRHWLRWYLDACAVAGGQAPSDIRPFLPWNMSEEQRQTLARPIAPIETQPTANSS